MLDLPKGQCPKVHVRFLKPFIVPDSITAQNTAATAISSMLSPEDAEDFARGLPAIVRGCFNCGGNHNLRDCHWPVEGKLCKSCGMKGVTVETCVRPRCQRKFRTSWKYLRGHCTHPYHQNVNLPSALIPQPLSPIPQPEDGNEDPEASPETQIVPESFVPPGEDEEGTQEDEVVQELAASSSQQPCKTVERTLVFSMGSDNPRDVVAYEELTAFFKLRGLSLAEGTPIGLTAFVVETSPGASSPEQDPDALELHPSLGDLDLQEPEGEYDVVAAVSDMEASGKFPQ